MPEPPKRFREPPKYKTFAGRRVRRNQRRIQQGKKPLAQPLEIASAEERHAAFSRGNMVFVHGKQTIELPLVLKFSRSGKSTIKFTGFLQGVYQAGKKLYSLRSRSLGNYSVIELFEIKKEKKHYREKPVVIKTPVGLGGFFKLSYISTLTSFRRQKDLAHMIIPENLRGFGIGLKAASKTEREQRALNNGSHSFEVYPKSRFLQSSLFEKLGYTVSRKGKKVFLAKKGRHQPKDDMERFHRIEAIDPKTGRTRIFTFPIMQG